MSRLQSQSIKIKEVLDNKNYNLKRSLSDPKHKKFQNNLILTFFSFILFFCIASKSFFSLFFNIKLLKIFQTSLSDFFRISSKLNNFSVFLVFQKRFSLC